MAAALIFGLTAVWLSVCAWSDWRTRQVSNWLTLPAVPVFLALRLAEVGEPAPVTVTVMAVGAFALFWYFNAMGGADVKALIAMSLYHPGLALAALLGSLLWAFILKRLHKADLSRRWAGFPGFALGMGVIEVGVLINLILKTWSKP